MPRKDGVDRFGRYDSRWTYDDIKEGFAFHVERYVLDDYSSGYNFVIWILARRRRPHGRDERAHGRGTTRRRKVRIVVG